MTDSPERAELETLRNEAKATLEIAYAWLVLGLDSTDDPTEAREGFAGAADGFDQLSTLALLLRERASTRLLQLPPDS